MSIPVIISLYISIIFIVYAIIHKYRLINDETEKYLSSLFWPISISITIIYVVGGLFFGAIYLIWLVMKLPFKIIEFYLDQK